MLPCGVVINDAFLPVHCSDGNEGVEGCRRAEFLCGTVREWDETGGRSTERWSGGNKKTLTPKKK